MEGVPIEFISQEKLQDQSFEDKLEMVLDEIKEDKILVLDESLSNEEKSRLIQSVMEEVDEEFPGIEFSGLDGHEDVFDRVINNLYSFVGRERKQGITILGNSEIMEKVEEKEDAVSLLAKSKGGD